jgi:hypothetical protein
MQGLAPDHVVYAGTASKTLVPGLRLGWLVAPPSLVEDLTAANADHSTTAVEALSVPAPSRRRRTVKHRPAYLIGDHHRPRQPARAERGPDEPYDQEDGYAKTPTWIAGCPRWPTAPQGG